ncbi:GGDEF domain-containing protein [uncultured Croceicoccus sp.]|uniref:sensor domain-containing diguanylate cyclase n=1 Tax=uncultured Croceicoccus sp. TaxID=1295329 RepID=UPI00262A5EA6|nr:GGDEF domain-containing protein [uncultured Croceicoccus sp.]
MKSPWGRAFHRGHGILDGFGPRAGAPALDDAAPDGCAIRWRLRAMLSLVAGGTIVMLALLVVLRPQVAHARTLHLSDFCYAVTALSTDDPPGPDAYDCAGPPEEYNTRSLWLRLKRTGAEDADAEAVLIIGNTRFERMEVRFVGVTGKVARYAVAVGDFSEHWRPGSKIAFSDHALNAPLESIVLRVDRLSDVQFLRMNITHDDEAALQFAALAATIGAGLTLLLIGALYNAGLAVAMRSGSAAWQGAWAACVLVWGLIWSQMILAFVPGLAGRTSAQIATFLACLAIFLATASVVSAIREARVPRALRRITAGTGALIGLSGIPLALMRTGPLHLLANIVGILVLGVLVLCAACIVVAWRRGHAPAISLGRAWAVPMLALGSVQVFDTQGMFWGGGSQVIVLYAAAWQTLWLAISTTAKYAHLRNERDRARSAEAIAYRMARQDALTGLGNRLHFIEAAEAMFGAGAGVSPVALLLIDVDRFKAINDGFGHDVGDEVLRCIADTLRRTSPAGFPVARMGGEEFVILTHGLAGGPLAAFAERVRAAVAECRHDVLGDGSRRITVSIGVAETRGQTAYDTLYRMADQALYAAKEAGRNRVNIAAVPNSPAMARPLAPEPDTARPASRVGAPTP